MTSIAANLQKIEQQIATAAARVGRDSSEIRLLPVSKTKPPEAVLEAHAAGYRRFGENKVQEAQNKWEALREVADIEWAVIGHLQSNKAKYILPERTPVRSRMASATTGYSGAKTPLAIASYSRAFSMLELPPVFIGTMGPLPSEPFAAITSKIGRASCRERV